MADIAITTANVAPSKYGVLITKLVGGASEIIQGQSVYLAADGTVQLFKANGAAPINVFFGIACSEGSPGQPIVVCTGDMGVPGSPGTGFNTGATLTVGEIVIGSGANAGGIAPSTDNVSGWVCQPIGLCVAAAANASIINFDVIANTIAT
jgi:hypothetical protein